MIPINVSGNGVYQDLRITSGTPLRERLPREPYVYNSRKIASRGCLAHKMMGAVADLLSARRAK
jgi:hypothetical protein